MSTLVFGHKTPDTDATCSALIWAWYLNEVRADPAEAVLLDPCNTEAAFVLTRWGFEMPRQIADVAAGQKVVVVDTNNVAELPPSINSAEVTEVIDHHLLQGGLATKTPIMVTIRPLASTATVMHGLMGADAEKMPDPIKALMLSCILSDTLALRSPTTTDTDRDLAVELATALDISMADYAAEMFAAKSDISGTTDGELIRFDSKIFEVDGAKLRVSVFETTSPTTVLERKDSIMAAIPAIATDDGIDQVLFFLIDILNEGATLFVPNDQVRAIAAKSFGIEFDGDLLDLPGVVSRKKQIIPALKV